MRRPLLLSLLAMLVPAGCATSEAASRAHPRGEAIYRPSCFEAPVEEEVALRAPAPTGAPAPSPRPSPKPRPSKKSNGGGGFGFGAGKAPATEAPADEAPPPPPATPAFEDLKAMGYTSDGDDAGFAGMPVPQEPEEPEEAERRQELADAEMLEKSKDERQSREVDANRPALDWGAEIYLSNDDSMSLASAQRLLYAVMNRISFSPREVRPHELLNYFSFDTVTPDADQLFDVLASAEQDGDRLSVALSVKGATPPRQPLDLTVLVDRSCSMQEEGRMDYTKRGLSVMADQLEEGDRVDVVLFDDAVCTPLENFVVGRDDPRLLEETIARMQPEGATDLDLGLREAYRVAKSHLDTHGRNRRMMVMTDAQLNTGDVNPSTVSEIGKAYEAENIRLTGVGVGRDFRDDVLDMLTEKGKGAYVYLGSEAVVDRIFGTGFASLVQTIAHDVRFKLELPPSLALERFYGEESSTEAADIQPIHYYAGTSQVFLQDLVVRDARAVRSDPVRLVVSYRDALTGEPAQRTFTTTVGKMLDTDPHNVRKGLALMAFSDVLLERAMGADACRSEALGRYGRGAAALSGDAEVAFVNGLVSEMCPGFELPATVAAASSVPYKVRVDSDIPIAEVALACGGHRWTSPLSGSDTVARFDAVPGRCEVTLSGTVAMTARVQVPKTGGDLRCLVRGGRLSCS